MYYLLSSTFLLTILAIFYPSAGVLSSRTKGREAQSCQSWFVASHPPLDPLVQAMTRPGTRPRACHQPHPMPPNRGCPSPSCQLLPPSPHAFRPFPLHPRFMPSSSCLRPTRSTTLQLHVSSPFSRMLPTVCLHRSVSHSPPFFNRTLCFISTTWIYSSFFDFGAIQ
jgi:hypothetical protein